MRVVVLFESLFGRTHEVAAAIAEPAGRRLMGRFVPLRHVIHVPTFAEPNVLVELAVRVGAYAQPMAFVTLVVRPELPHDPAG